MKKLALTSLLAVFAISGANAANVIDGNPLYMPGQNHFYSVTTLGSHTEQGTPYGLGEEFGYGITDRLAVNLETSMTENRAFDEYSIDGLGFSATFRALDMNGWKVDALAGYGFSGIYEHPKPQGEDAWFDKDETFYTWMAGVRGGFVASNWTVAAKTLFEYTNTRSFNWNGDRGHQGIHELVLGVEGQYVLCDHLSFLANVEYTGVMDKYWHGDKDEKVENAGEWFGELGINYNIDATKYVGLYINGTLNHWKGEDVESVANPKKGWGFEDGFGYGVRFGIDF